MLGQVGTLHTQQASCAVFWALENAMVKWEIYSGDFSSGLFPRVFQEFLIQLPTKPSPFGWKLDGFIFGSYKQMSSNNFLVTCGYREFNWDNSHCPHPIPKARLKSFQNPLNRSQSSQTARWDEKT